ncbi:SPOR domain-containing protein [Rhodobacteraceae bacterium]|nr:SPOR domain-containing protein [Paracoccaceae bacterium]
MLRRLFRICAFFICAAQAVGAQTAGPAEEPPAGFGARQYVDSAGCVFVRRADDGNGWVARRGRDGAPICGYSPSLPERAASLQPGIAGIDILSGAGSRCPNAPARITRYRLSDGRHVVRCGPPARDPVGFINSAGISGLRVGNGGLPAPQTPALVGARTQTGAGFADRRPDVRDAPEFDMVPGAPELPPAALVAPAPVAQNATPATQGLADTAPDIRQDTQQSTAAPAADVHTAQPQVDAPATTQHTGVQPAARAPSATPARINAVPRNQPAHRSAPADPRGYFVQAGIYRKPANAKRAKTLLWGGDLPVASAQNGRGMTAIYSGPFREIGAARAALATVRRLGFADAFIR